MGQNSSNFLGKIPMVTRNLIIVNVIVWIATLLLSRNGSFDNYLGLHYVTSKAFMPHQFITYMFMHGSLWHIFFNMFALYVFGRTLEIVWGPKKFLCYYIVTGIGAALFQIIITYLKVRHIETLIPGEMLANFYNHGIDGFINGNYINPNIADLYVLINSPMIGASGAIFGILIAFGMTFPNAAMFVIPIPFPIKAKWLVGFYALLELVLGFTNSMSNVAHFAHLGGLLTGFIIILIWKRKAKSNGKFY